jgi:general secretion pathway protein G
MPLNHRLRRTTQLTCNLRNTGRPTSRRMPLPRDTPTRDQQETATPLRKVSLSTDSPKGGPPTFLPGPTLQRWPFYWLTPYCQLVINGVIGEVGTRRHYRPQGITEVVFRPSHDLESNGHIIMAGMNAPRWRHGTKLGLLVALAAPGVFLVWFVHFWRAETLVPAEAVVKVDLQTMRTAIDNYSSEKRYPPPSLQSLVDEKYLREIPVNPITNKVDWASHYVRVIQEDGRPIVGIDDVHASPGKTGWDGTPDSEW